MSFANPTPIQVGTWGTFNGVRYRVAGRVVLGVDIDGDRFYWNEFNLVSDGFGTATLVHEEGERGAEWRLFILFEPDYPMSVEDAAGKRVGDYINLEGTGVRITLVDESRVYHIEGDAPEGVELGDVANYFNAKLGKDMIVVSWTGSEVEYYRGVDLTSGMVAGAFGLRGQEFNSFLEQTGGGTSFLSSSSFADSSEVVGKRTLQIILAVLIVVMVFVGYATCRPIRPPMPIAKVSAPAAPFAFGEEGMFDDKTWRVRAHAVVEIAQVGKIYERHEYHLTDHDGNRALLVCGLKPGDKNWIWFEPLDPIEPLTPLQAAALRQGESVNISGLIAPVGPPFQSVMRQTSSELMDVRDGLVFFGFMARADSTLLLVRWNSTSITFYRGRILAAKDAMTAFKKQ